MVETVGLDRHMSKLKEWYPLRADHFSVYKLYLGFKTKKEIDISLIFEYFKVSLFSIRWRYCLGFKFGGRGSFLFGVFIFGPVL